MKSSVLITYYNERGLLTECLESLRTQTAPVDEILVYDDASQYPARDYVPPGLPVRVVRGAANIGPGRGRNALLAEASGDWVHFHDSDDLFHADWSERVGGQFREGADTVLTEVEAIRGGVLQPWPVIGFDPAAAERDMLTVALRGVILVIAGSHRTSLARQTGGFRESLWQSEDFDFHVRIAAALPVVRAIGDPLVTIRVREESRSQNRYECWRDLLASVRLLADELPPERRPELAERAFQAAVELHRLGHPAESAAAVKVARGLGRIEYRYASRLQKATYRLLPLPWAEAVGSSYRKLLPERLRRGVQ